MFSLILKDFMLLRVRMWFQVGLWIFFMVNVSGSGLPFLAISMIMVSIPIGADEKNKTESLLVSLPVKRSTIVIARYLYILVVIALVMAVTYFSSRVLHILSPAQFERVVPFDWLLAPQLFVMFFMSLALPIIFRYGSHLEAGIRVIAVSISVIIGAVILLIVIWDSMGINILAVKLVYTSLGMGVVMLISMGISLLIYKRREF